MVRPRQWLHEHRTHTFVALLLCSVAAVGVTAGALVGLAGGGNEPAQPRRTPVAAADPVAPPATPTPTAAPSPVRQTSPAETDVERGRRNDVGYFLAASEGDDGVHITFDRVQYLTGKAATRYAEKRNQPPPPSGVLVVNENPKKRTLVLSDDVVVFGGPRLAGTTELQQIDARQLLTALPEKGSATLLEVTYDDFGYVTEVKEKQLP